jgi:hypothetical protein
MAYEIDQLKIHPFKFRGKYCRGLMHFDLVLTDFAFTS